MSPPRPVRPVMATVSSENSARQPHHDGDGDGFDDVVSIAGRLEGSASYQPSYSLHQPATSAALSVAEAAGSFSPPQPPHARISGEFQIPVALARSVAPSPAPGQRIESGAPLSMPPQQQPQQQQAAQYPPPQQQQQIAYIVSQPPPPAQQQPAYLVQQQQQPAAGYYLPPAAPQQQQQPPPPQRQQQEEVDGRGAMDILPHARHT